MAKSARSNNKKALRTWRREKLVAKWQTDADEKRYAALQAIAEQPKPEAPPKATSGDDDDVPMVTEQRARGGKAPKDVQMDTDAQEGKGKKGRKGTKVGVNKKRKAGKLFFKTGEFHGKKGSKVRPGRT